MNKSERVKERLEELDKMTMTELKKLWHLHFDWKPTRVTRDFIVRRIAYKIQTKAYGGLSKNTRNKIKKLANQEDTCQKPTYFLRNGTRLYRDWNDKRYIVLVKIDGFEYEGKFFKSLTPIATKIVGSKRSGPEFFGLTHPRSDGL